MSWFGIKTICGVAMAAGVVFGTAESSACSCSEEASLLWPGPDDEVTVDTTLVVAHIGQPLQYARLESGDTGVGNSDAGAAEAGVEPSAGLILRSEDGDWAELSGVRQVANSVICAGNLFIVEPREVLTPDTEYTLLNDDDEIATFTTASQAESSDDREPDAFEWSVLGADSDPSLILSVFITGQFDRPVIVSWQGRRVEARLVRPDEEFESGAFAVDVGGVECPEIELIGVDGSTWDSRVVCEAQRCTDAELESRSSCEENPTVGVSYDEFLELPVDCGVEAELPPPSVNEVDPAPDEGCAFSSRGSSNDSPPWAVLALGAVAAAVSRRRVQ